MNGLAERRNHRLKNFDYGSYNYYYVTICTKNKECLLSEITVGSDAPVAPEDNRIISWEDAVSCPTEIGQKVIECWNNIQNLNDKVEVNKFVLMPNHIHGIIIIRNTDSIELFEKKYDFQIAERRGRRSLQGLIKDFKSVTTRHYKKTCNASQSLWQESFFDTVITSQEQYENICRYIDCNPLNWVLDEPSCEHEENIFK